MLLCTIILDMVNQEECHLKIIPIMILKWYMIIHSPFMSGMRVITPSRLLACLDIFPNINRIHKVQCPVMIIHGVLDQEVHISHGKALHDAVPENYQRNPWWVRDRGHNDITEGRAKL